MFKSLKSKTFGFLGAAVVWTSEQKSTENSIYIEHAEKRPQEISKSKENIFRYGKPNPNVTLNYANYTVCYDLERRIPKYVAERITRDHISGNVDRKALGEHFRPDFAVDAIFMSQNNDYQGSGWSRGHMAAAANHKHNANAMGETFFRNS